MSRHSLRLAAVAWLVAAPVLAGAAGNLGRQPTRVPLNLTRPALNRARGGTLLLPPGLQGLGRSLPRTLVPVGMSGGLDHLRAQPQPKGLPLSRVSLQNLGVAAAQTGASARFEALAGTTFDGSDGSGGSGGSGGGGSGPGYSPTVPPGVRKIHIWEITRAVDVGAAIPAGANSEFLIEALEDRIGDMAPYYVNTYYDQVGGKFTGIDLARKPELVDILPEQQSHEVRLIKKLLSWNRDLQVVVREDGKTPDTIVGGRVTELKSLIGDKVTLTYLVDKANTQVYEHAERHQLGPGAIAIDLWAHDKVPVEQALAEINAWVDKPIGYRIPGSYEGPRVHKRPNHTQAIYLFAGDDLAVLERGADGRYAVGPRRIPVRRARKTEAVPAPQQKPRTAMGWALEIATLLREFNRFYNVRKYRSAVRVWRDFTDNAPERMVADARKQLGRRLNEAEELSSRRGKKKHTKMRRGRR